MKEMEIKKLFKGFICVLSIAALTACSNVTIEGSWLEPVPGMPGVEQGFTLAEDGSASSINMATLQYEKWEQKENLLILFGKSIGNHQTISFSDTLVIEKLTQKELILKQKELTTTYSRQKKSQ